MTLGKTKRSRSWPSFKLHVGSSKALLWVGSGVMRAAGGPDEQQWLQVGCYSRCWLSEERGPEACQGQTAQKKVILARAETTYLKCVQAV